MKEKFEDIFDCVVMLTWSDWHTEPRSNRFHYATRFARRLPVFFVQPDGEEGEAAFEKVDGHDITIVRIGPGYGAEQAAQLARALRERGAARPLVWMYNVYLANAVSRLHPMLTVYHATEDYVGPDQESMELAGDIRGAVGQALAQSDMVVAVSEGVAASYKQHGGYGGPILVLPNGCDFAFWEAGGASDYAPAPGNANVALYQGGINSRLDYDLLTQVARRLPDWQFWFCGRSAGRQDAWTKLKNEPNVRDFGMLSPEGIAGLARQARVGLIPFKGYDLMRRSLPLKAYEYLACGLPVVSIPIDALAERPDLFDIADDAEGFVEAIERVAPTRTDPEMVGRRLAAARAASYDTRFDELADAILKRIERRRDATPSLNVLMLYDDRSTHVGTIVEHLEAFRKYSRHRFHYMPATGLHPLADGGRRQLDLSHYDAIMLHYSVRISIPDHLSEGVASAISAYRGPKLLFIQDEYDCTGTALRWIGKLGIDTIFTNVPEEGREFVYPRSLLPNVSFIPTLTGYVPEDPSIEQHARPIAERKLLIVYRGRVLPHQYGQLGYEKYRIGIDVRRLAEERGLPVDIEVDDAKRIYGADWYRFIGSGRATLGTESGSNVFDFDGELARLAGKHADMAFPEFAERHLKEHEAKVRMNQVSPKIFEAIRLRTALVLFEGDYSGVVRPDRHFIALKKDCSNIDEVFAKLRDDAYLEALTGRAYSDVIGSGRYSYRSFVEGVDRHLGAATMGRRRATIVSVPLFAVYDGHGAIPLWTGAASEVLQSDTVLGPELTREQIVSIAATTATPQSMLQRLLRPTIVTPLKGLARRVRYRNDLMSRLLRSAAAHLPERLKRRLILLIR